MVEPEQLNLHILHRVAYFENIYTFVYFILLYLCMYICIYILFIVCYFIYGYYLFIFFKNFDNYL